MPYKEELELHLSKLEEARQKVLNSEHNIMMTRQELKDCIGILEDALNDSVLVNEIVVAHTGEPSGTAGSTDFRIRITSDTLHRVFQHRQIPEFLVDALRTAMPEIVRHLKDRVEVDLFSSYDAEIRELTHSIDELHDKLTELKKERDANFNTKR